MATSPKMILFAFLIVAPVAAIAGAWVFLDKGGYLLHWTGPSSERVPNFVLAIDPVSLNEGLRSGIVLALKDARISVLSSKVDDEGVDVSIAEARVQAGLAQIAKFYEAQQIIVRRGDNGTVRISHSPTRISELKRAMAEKSARIIEARLSELGGFRFSNLSGYKLSVVTQSDGTIAVRVSQASDIGRLVDFAIKPANLQFRLVNTRVQLDKALSGSLPEFEVLYHRQQDGNKPLIVAKRAILSGQDFDDVKPGADQRSSEPIVAFRLNIDGSRKLAQATSENVGQPLAFVFDGEILSAPIIREPILGGQGQISAGFTEQAAKDLAILLRFGQLPVRLKVAERQ